MILIYLRFFCFLDSVNFLLKNAILANKKHCETYLNKFIHLDLISMALKKKKKKKKATQKEEESSDSEEEEKPEIKVESKTSSR